MAVDIESNLESNLENILKNYKSAELTKINTGELCVICSSEEIFDLLKKGFDKVKDKKVKIMVTHVQPSDSLMDKLSDFLPGSDLRP